MGNDDIGVATRALEAAIKIPQKKKPKKAITESEFILGHCRMGNIGS